MKKNIITLFALLAVALSCEKAKIPNEDTLKDLPVTRLEVKYSVDEAEVKSLAFNSKSHDVVLHVDVNNDNLNWKLESNRTWCVVEGDGRGSGDIVLHIQENEAFIDRSSATLTFVAGDFRGYQLSVDQTGSVYILGQPYFIEGKGEATLELNVTTPAGLVWDFDSSESWINPQVSSTAASDDFVTYKLSVKISANEGETRFGKFELIDENRSYTPAAIYVSQFGTEYNYTSEGQILLPSDNSREISFIAPVKTIDTIDLPKFASYTVTEATEETERITIKLEDNLSDCQEGRDVPVQVRLSNVSATVIELPAMRQDYVDAHGLMSAKGISRFAKVVNEGGDISGWMREGEVVVLQDIDMEDLDKAWESIGTAAHPFSAVFNGGGHKITNLKVSPAPVFGVCSGAAIKNLTIDSSCSFYSDETFPQGKNFAALAAELKGSSVTSCKVAADVVMAGKNSMLGEVILGGIAAKVDAGSSVKACDVEGELTLSSTLATGSNAFVGGAAGYCEGEVSACTSASVMSLVSSANNLRAGAITSCLTPTTKATNNAFLGTLECINSSLNIAAGGLYGLVSGTRVMDFSSDKSSSMGAIKVASLGNASTIASIGSFIGALDSEANLTFNGFESTTSLSIDFTNVQKASVVNIGGFIGGSAPGAEAVLSASNLTNKGALSDPAQTATVVVMNIKNCNLGGIVGSLSGNLNIKNCDNIGSIGLEQINARSNGYALIMGGIIGHALDGECVVEKCTNSGVILNFSYNNNAWTGYNSNVSGGIVGAYDYLAEREGNHVAKISDCVCSAGQWGYRGICGGIIGFAADVQINKCSCTGHMNGSKGPGNLNTNNHAYVGGIAGVILSGTITGCNAIVNIFAGSPGSEFANGGGIVGVVATKATINECSYYGDISKAGSKDGETAGGIVGASTASTNIVSSKFGGSVAGQKISSMNAANLASGDGNARVTDVIYWDGQ